MIAEVIALLVILSVRHPEGGVNELPPPSSEVYRPPAQPHKRGDAL